MLVIIFAKAYSSLKVFNIISLVGPYSVERFEGTNNSPPASATLFWGEEGDQVGKIKFKPL